jgi:hypothetical protein
VETASASVIAYRRKPDGGFGAEQYSGRDAVIALPEIEVSLTLADLYGRVEFEA